MPKIQRFFCASIFVSTFGLAQAQAQTPIITPEIKCLAISEDHMPMAFQLISNGTAATEHVLGGASEYAGAAIIHYRYRAGKSPILTTDMAHPSEDTEHFEIERIDSTQYRLRYQAHRMSKETFQDVHFEGEAIGSCLVVGQWPEFFSTGPSTAVELSQFFEGTQFPKDGLKKALTIVDNGDIPDDEKLLFYRMVISDFDEDATWKSPKANDVVTGLINSIFASSLSSDKKSALLETLSTPDRRGLSAIVDASRSLAACSDCEISDALFTHILDSTQRLLKAGKSDKNLNQLLLALSRLTFSSRTDALKDKAVAEKLLFSPEVTSICGTEVQNGYIQVLTLFLPYEKLSRNSAKYFDRIFSPGFYNSATAQALLIGLMQNHAEYSTLKTMLPLQAQLSLLRRIDKSGKLPLGMSSALRRQIYFITAEKTLRVSDSDEGKVATAVSFTQAPMRPMAMSSALQWLIEQHDIVPGGGAVVDSIIAQLPHVPSQDLFYSLENHARGLTMDLIRYAFSAQGRKQGQTVSVVRAVLADARTPWISLSCILADLQDDGLTVADKNDLLVRIAHHPQFYLGDGQARPTDIVLTLLENSVKTERQRRRPQLSIDALRGVVNEMLESKRLDFPLREKAHQQIKASDSF